MDNQNKENQNKENIQTARYNEWGEKIMTKEEGMADMESMKRRLLKRSLIRTAVIILAIIVYFVLKV